MFGDLRKTTMDVFQLWFDLKSNNLEMFVLQDCFSDHIPCWNWGLVTFFDRQYQIYQPTAYNPEV